VQIYISKTEKVWQTQVKAKYINNIRCHFSATLCLVTVLYYLTDVYGENFEFRMEEGADCKCSG